MSSPPPTIRDLANVPCGYWFPVEYAGAKPHRWRCRCKCGTERVIPHVDLCSGSTTSCGCRLRAGNRNKQLRRHRWPKIARATVETWVVLLDRGHVHKLRAAMVKAAREPADTRRGRE